MSQETELKPRAGVVIPGAEAAHAVYAAGGSPRAQIDAARSASGQKLVYLPHIGRRQRERNLARLAKQKTPANAEEAQG